MWSEESEAENGEVRVPVSQLRGERFDSRKKSAWQTLAGMTEHNTKKDMSTTSGHYANNLYSSCHLNQSQTEEDQQARCGNGMFSHTSSSALTRVAVVSSCSAVAFTGVLLQDSCTARLPIATFSPCSEEKRH
ncbi:hypothetical protein C0Q70_18912 [Pomacea canaliculata]|uniref:Uncharacterized protein n=1 Tax=Pomacea canaliculata TaxID=400727 RepID=A0A2T7NHU7_POMCA|nr:hypothetical protein C0Q70_18912 [Pomacea canaliculata]